MPTRVAKAPRLRYNGTTMSRWGDKYLSPGFLGTRFRCTCGQEHEIPVRRVVISDDATEALAGLAGELGLGKRVAMVADENTYHAAAVKAQAHLEANGFTVAGTLLQPHTGRYVKADEKTAAELMARLDTEASWLLAVGSGTINDLTKLSAARRNLPYVALATATSMNGYGSPLVSLAVDGIKMMVDARAPVAVVGDLGVLSSAPPEMTRAGVGDMLARSLANTDWKIASAIAGDHYCPLSIEILEGLEGVLLGNSEGISRSDPEALEVLFRALMLSSFSLLIAGTSAPGSGAEHLVSHLWDTLALTRGEDARLHGIQVGIGTVLSSRLYRRLETIDPDGLDAGALAARYRERGQLEPELRRFFGPVADRVLEEFSKKCPPREEKREQLETIVRRWPEFMEEARSAVQAPEVLVDILQRVGAPSSPEDIGIPDELLRETIIHAREIRGRYTAFDLAEDVGVLEDFAATVAGR